MKKKEKRENPSKSREKYLIFTGVKGEVQLHSEMLVQRTGEEKRRRGEKEAGSIPKACPMRDTCVDTGIVVRNAATWTRGGELSSASGLSVKGYPGRHN